MVHVFLLLNLLAAAERYTAQRIDAAVESCRTYAEETARGRNLPRVHGEFAVQPEDRLFLACMADVARSMPDRGPRP